MTYGQPMMNANSDQLLYEQSSCSLEYQTIDLDSLSSQSNHSYGGGQTWIHYYPRCIRVPRCIGCCSKRGQINFDDWNERQCRPINVQYKTVIQTGQSIDHNGMKKLFRRKIQVAYHTGCQCQCRQNPRCQNIRQKFYDDSCRCECRPEIATERFECSKRLTIHGHMFWDNDRCECRCPQFYYAYIHHLNPMPSDTYCPSGHYLQLNNCRCIRQKNNIIL
ncbi:VEGF protein-like protein [Euroglyphus maynei]|uniref:VEGF protein-like protein n=1 Tax=Euroglyphus maynei TaxID=6958 RepID=A0A1Y3B4C3_EURMA|nr:VEGF protein-like protein [Euroglyphus maynei]